MQAYADKKQTTVDSRKMVTPKIPSQMRTAAPNVTGIPSAMKTRFESLSGFSFDDVRVHYNSDKPAQLHALAYTQGNQVYVAPGQEKHLCHELGHVIQQKQGRVEPTHYVTGVPVNMSHSLEQEADRIADEQPVQRLTESKGKPEGDTVQLWHGAYNEYLMFELQAMDRMDALHIPDPAQAAIVDSSEQNLEMHHVIPRELCTQNFTGTDLDDVNVNGIALPATKGLSYLFGRVAHHGPHPNYSIDVGRMLVAGCPGRRNANAILRDFIGGFTTMQESAAVYRVIADCKQLLGGNRPNRVLD